MGQITLIIAFIMVFYVFSQGVVAQTTESTEVTPQGSETTSQTGLPSQVTNTPQSQPDAPIIDNSGIVYPRENLDPFGMSTLGSPTDSGFRKDTSTLGTGTRRKSNLEINKPRERKAIEEEIQEEEAIQEETTFETDTEESAESISSFSPGRVGEIYKWVDKNGVLHVTNDLGSVPAEYRQQVMNRSQESEGVEP
ncbi:MAG TPA: DUF4124 domain-containing protein [Thermodesulfobacteriota bacterium]|nr:DUF4124 domain-containing protein [Thermodesulfobacteriota bacterium]